MSEDSPFFLGSELVESVLPATVAGCTCTGVVVASICELRKCIVSEVKMVTKVYPLHWMAKV